MTAEVVYVVMERLDRKSVPECGGVEDDYAEFVMNMQL